MDIKRGDIYYADLNPVIGSEQGGIRPVLIMQNDKGNKRSPTVIVAAITSKLNKIKIPIHIEISSQECGLSMNSIILLEQIRTIDKKRLRKRIGHVTPEIMEQVDEALKIGLGVKTKEAGMDNKLIPIEHKNQRVLTTQQLADGYGATTDQIKQNYSNNKARYISEIHYFILEGEELKVFKNEVENFDLAPTVNKIFLWTENGALLHAKSLNTDKAWKVYQHLVDTYFRVKELQKPMTIEDMIILQAQSVKELKSQVNQLSTQITDMRNGMVDIDTPLRTQFNDLVRKAAKDNGLQYNNLYKEIYTLLGKQEHIDIFQRAKNRNCSLIDVVDKSDYLVKAIRLVKTMYPDKEPEKSA